MRSYSRSRSRRRRSRSRSRSRMGHRGRMRGTAMRWNNDRGFGFIQPEGGGDDIFCHFSAVEDGNCLGEGAPVEYDEKWNERNGKYNAANVTGGMTSDRGPGYGGGGVVVLVARGHRSAGILRRACVTVAHPAVSHTMVAGAVGGMTTVVEGG